SSIDHRHFNSPNGAALMYAPRIDNLNDSPNDLRISDLQRIVMNAQRAVGWNAFNDALNACHFHSGSQLVNGIIDLRRNHWFKLNQHHSISAGTEFRGWSKHAG